MRSLPLKGNDPFVRMVHSWVQHLGLGRMKVEWLCVMAKAELGELPPTGFIEEQPLGQDGLVGLESLRSTLLWRIMLSCARDNINETLFSLYRQCQQQGSVPVLYSGTVWRGDASPASRL